MKKQKVYIGEGGEYDGFIFISEFYGDYYSYSNGELGIFLGYGKQLIIRGTKLIPIGTL